MARRLDFSPIDYQREILADPVGKAMAGAIRKTGEQAAGTIQELGKQKKQREADFVEKMKFDTAITSDIVINDSIAGQYDLVKDKWVDVFDQRKGRLTAQDKIAMNADLEALNKMAVSYKTIANNYQQAKKTGATKDGRMRYDIDDEGYTEFLNTISGENSPEDLNAYLDSLYQSSSGQPFLKVRAFDPDTLLNDELNAFIKANPGDPETRKVVSESGGKKYTKTITTTPVKNPEKFGGSFLSGFTQNPFAENYDQGIQEKLTDEQRMQAIEKYGNKLPYLQYYMNEVKGEHINEKLQPAKKTFRASEPVKKGGGGLMFNFGGGKAAKGALTPQEDNVEGVELKEYYEFAKERPTPKTVKGVTVKGAKLLSDGNEGEAEDRTTPGDYNVIGYDMDSDNVVLQQKVVTKSGTTIYDVFKAPREGNEHFLSGLLNDETIAEIGKRQAVKQKDAGKVYNLEGVGEFTKKELLDAGWTEAQIKELLEN